MNGIHSTTVRYSSFMCGPGTQPTFQCHVTIATSTYLPSQLKNIQAPLGAKPTGVANLCTSFQCFSKFCLSYHPYNCGFWRDILASRKIWQHLLTCNSRQLCFQPSGCNSGSKLVWWQTWHKKLLIFPPIPRLHTLPFSHLSQCNGL